MEAAPSVAAFIAKALENIAGVELWTGLDISWQLRPVKLPGHVRMP